MWFKLKDVLNLSQEVNVIRIEDDVGMGPFRSKINVYEEPLLEKCLSKYFLLGSKRSFPTPIQEGLIPVWNKRWFCAFNSIEQLFNFFNKSELSHLISLGFKVKKLTTTNYVVGEFQTIYTKDSILKEEDISQTLINEYETSEMCECR